MRLTLLYVFIILLSGCQFLKSRRSGTEDENPIARAYDKYLYPSDLSGLNFTGLSKEDSTPLVTKYIKEWAQHQVIAEIAIEKDNIDLERIELKAEELKYQLITYEFEKSLVNSSLDTLISTQEIEDYYTKHKSDFELKQNIIRGYYVKLQKDSPHISKFKSAFQSNNNDKLAYIQEYCTEHADQYNLNDSVWFNFNEIVFGSPYQKIDDQTSFLQNPSNTSKYDGEYYYFFRVIESRLKNEISPLQFHKHEISNIIYNQRKLELIKNVEEKLFKEALDDQSIEYYN